MRIPPWAVFSIAVIFLGKPARAERFLTESVFLPPMETGNVIGAEFRNSELHNAEVFHRRQSLSAFAEFQVIPSVSVFGALPYSRDWYTDLVRAEHIDNAPLGVRYFFPAKDWALAAGITAVLPTGNDKVRIGSRSLGNAEFYIGAGFHPGALSFSGTVRYNTQSNRKLMEEIGQEFERTWLIQASAGVRIGAAQLTMELDRKMRDDPENRRLNTTTLAPGAGIQIGNVFIGVAFPHAATREREYDRGFVFKSMMFY